MDIYQKQHLKQLNVAKKLQILFFMLIGAVIIWIIYLFGNTMYYNLKENAASANQLNTVLSSSVSYALSQMKEQSAFPVLYNAKGNNSVLYNLLSEKKTFRDSPRLRNECNNAFKNYLDLSNTYNVIAIYDSTNVGLYSEKSSPSYNTGLLCALDSKQASWHQTVLQKRGAAVIIPPQDFKGSGLSMEGDIIVVARSIVDAHTYESLGIIVLGLDLNYFSNLFHTDYRETSIHYTIIDNSAPIAGDIIENKKIYKALSKLSSGQRKTVYDFFAFNIFNIYNVDNQIFTIICLDVNTPFFYNPFNILILIILIGLLMLGIVFAKYIISSINEPLNQLLYAISTVEKEDYTYKLNLDNISPEFRTLFQSFNKMNEHTSFLVNEILRRDLNKKNLSLQYLTGQINSHALYNTLECIRMEAYVHHDLRVSEAISLLGETLRYSLHGIDQHITLQEELQHVENYLELTNYLHKKVTYSIHIDEFCKSIPIYKMFLQPIVENSVQHAFRDDNTTLHIEIWGFLSEGFLTISISDDGIGMSEKTLMALQDSLHNEDSSGGIGLVNVQRRLHLYYGDNGNIEIRSQENLGTIVFVTLPVNE